MGEKIYGYFINGESEGEYDVTIVLPPVYAGFFRVDSQWDMVLAESRQNLKWAAIETIEEQAAGDTDDELYDSFCLYLEDDGNWEGDIEEGEVLEGMEAAKMFLNGFTKGGRYEKGYGL